MWNKKSLEITTAALSAACLITLASCGSNNFKFNDTQQSITETTTATTTPTSSTPVTGSVSLDVASESILQKVNFVLAHNTSANFVRFKDLIDQALQGFLVQLKNYPVLVTTLSLNRSVGLNSSLTTSGRSLLTTCQPPFDSTLGSTTNPVDLYYSCKNSLPPSRITNKLEFKASTVSPDPVFDANVTILKKNIASSIGDPALNASTRVENLLSVFADKNNPVLDGGITIAVLMSHTDYSAAENTGGVFQREYTPNQKLPHAATKEAVITYTSLNSAATRNEQSYTFEYKWSKLNTDASGAIVEERTPLQKTIAKCSALATGATSATVSPGISSSEPDAPGAFCPLTPAAESASVIPCTSAQVSYLSRINNNALIISDTSDPDSCKLTKVSAVSQTGSTTNNNTVTVPITNDSNPISCADPFTRLDSLGNQTAFTSVSQYLISQASSLPGINEACTGVTTRARNNYYYQAGSVVRVAYSGSTTGTEYGRMTTNLAKQLVANGAPYRVFVLSVPSDTSDCLGQSAKATPNFNNTASSLNQVTASTAFTKSICSSTALSESLQQASEFIQTIQGRTYSISPAVSNLSITSVSILKTDGTSEALTKGPGTNQYQFSVLSSSNPSKAEIYLGSAVSLPTGAKVVINYEGTQP